MIKRSQRYGSAVTASQEQKCRRAPGIALRLRYRHPLAICRWRYESGSTQHKEYESNDQNESK
jgi:hypothetical protein